MDRSIEYAQALSNFDSVYNAPTHLANPTPHQPPTFSSFPDVLYRPASPLFRQCASPTSRVPLLYGPGPKFNFDLYAMDEDLDVYERDSLNSYRPRSPLLSTEMLHDTVFSLLPPSDSKLQAVEKLRHINDEMCQSLARSEAVDAIDRPPRHYHIHHYPVSQLMAAQRLPMELEAPPAFDQAPVTYRIHSPQREQPHRRSSFSNPMRPSVEYTTREDPQIIDLYPTRDGGFTKRIPTRGEREGPWVVHGNSVERPTYSDMNAARPPPIPREPYYESQRQKTPRRVTREHRRHSPSSVTSPHRSSGAFVYTSDPVREPSVTFSKSSPVRYSINSPKRSKSIHSRASPRGTSPASTDRRHQQKHITAFSSDGESVSSSMNEPVWKSSPRSVPHRSSARLHTPFKHEYDASSRRRSNDGTESESMQQRRVVSARTKVRTDDPKFKHRIAETESKVKSAWEPTVNAVQPVNVKHAESSVPVVIKKTRKSGPEAKSHETPPPSEPATPVRKASTQDEVTARGNVDDLFGNESQTSERSEKESAALKPHAEEIVPVLPTPPETDIAKGAVDHDTADKPGNDSPKKEPTDQTVPPTSAAADKEASIVGSEHRKSPPPEALPVQPHTTDDHSVDQDDDEDDQEVARSFDISKWLEDASQAIIGATKKSDPAPPATPPPAPLRPASHSTPTSKPKPRRKEQTPSPVPSSPDHNLYKPPFGPKRVDKQPATQPQADITDAVDDFFS